MSAPTLKRSSSAAELDSPPAGPSSAAAAPRSADDDESHNCVQRKKRRKKEKRRLVEASRNFTRAKREFANAALQYGNDDDVHYAIKELDPEEGTFEGFEDWEYEKALRVGAHRFKGTLPFGKWTKKHWDHWEDPSRDDGVWEDPDAADWITLRGKLAYLLKNENFVV